MQIDFEMPGKVDETRLNRFLLPAGFVAEQIGPETFHILTERNRIQVGACHFVDPMVTVTFFGKSDLDLWFINAFGLEHPECDPRTEMFGVVHQVPPDGLFHLDVMPLMKRKEALKNITKYVAEEKVYFVSFFRGNWTPADLKVNSMRKIFFDGSLGDEEEAPLFLPLENLPDEATK